MLWTKLIFAYTEFCKSIAIYKVYIVFFLAMAFSPREEQDWNQLLQWIRCLPVDFKLDMGEQRFDALGKDLCLSELYAKRPQLRTRMASCGGLRGVWDHCHSAAADSADLHQAWQKLCADLRGCSVAESDTSDTWQLGQTLAESLGIEQRLEEHRGMREHLRLEGGISDLALEVKLLHPRRLTCCPEFRDSLPQFS